MSSFVGQISGFFLREYFQGLPYDRLCILASHYQISYGSDDKATLVERMVFSGRQFDIEVQRLVR